MHENRGLWRGKTKPKSNGEAFNSVWVEGNLIRSRGSYYIHPKANSVNVQGELGQLVVMHEVDPSTLGECTGLEDKNYKLIFEGDIVHAIYDIGYGGVKAADFGNGVVEYHGSYYSGARWEMNIIGESGCRVFSASVKCEVIGNIYDNPELLKAATGEDIGNAAQDTLIPAT